MKHILITTIAAVVLVGCGESQQSAPAPETKPVEPVAEAAKPEPPTAKAPDISIHEAAKKGNIEAVKQHLAAGKDVNAKDYRGWTPLYFAAANGHKEFAELLVDKGADVNAMADGGLTPLHTAALRGRKEIAELLIAKGANVNAIDAAGQTPLDWAVGGNYKETADLLRKHGGKTNQQKTLHSILMGHQCFKRVIVILLQILTNIKVVYGKCLINLETVLAPVMRI
jgi:ankyrin repeat protein